MYREGASCSIRLYKVTGKEQVVVLGFTRLQGRSKL